MVRRTCYKHAVTQTRSRRGCAWIYGTISAGGLSSTYPIVNGLWIQADTSADYEPRDRLEGVIDIYESRKRRR